MTVPAGCVEGGVENPVDRRGRRAKRRFTLRTKPLGRRVAVETAAPKRKSALRSL